MKANTMKLANAFALAMTVLWVICSLFVWLLPDLSLQIISWWMHGMDLSVMGSWHLSVSNFVLGGISAIVSAWVTGWVLAWAWQAVGGNNRK